VQSMTNTDTRRSAGHCDAGSRARPRRLGSRARHRQHRRGRRRRVPRIRERLDAMGCDVPLVGDFHFKRPQASRRAPRLRARCWQSTGSIGQGRAGRKRDEQFATLIEMACRYDKP